MNNELVFWNIILILYIIFIYYWYEKKTATFIIIFMSILGTISYYVTEDLTSLFVKTILGGVLFMIFVSLNYPPSRNVIINCFSNIFNKSNVIINKLKNRSKNGK